MYNTSATIQALYRMQYQLYKPGVYGIYKQVAETPLQALVRLRGLAGIPGEESLTYAGRFDPMAEGLLLVLSGEAIKDKAAYLNMPKKYTVSFLCGVTTDSGDVLGIPQFAALQKAVQQKDVEKAVLHMQGILQLPIPQYSSVPVHGKPLWLHAQQGSDAEIPLRESVVHSAQLQNFSSLFPQEILSYLEQSMPQVLGVFRQEEIMHAWRLALNNLKEPFGVAQVELLVSSGTYIRSWVPAIGNMLGTGACVYTLTRTSVGEFCM